MSKPKPYRNKGQGGGQRRGGGNNRRSGGGRGDQNHRKDAGPQQSSSAATDPGFESATLLAFLLSIGAYAAGVIGLLLRETHPKWSWTLLFFARAMAIGGVLFAIVLARAMETLSSSERWKINGAIYPGLSYLLAYLFTIYAPHGMIWGASILGGAFLLGLITTVLFSWKR